jgi:hypothetical protein
MEYLGAWVTLIYEKKLRSKISCQTPFKIKNALQRTKIGQEICDTYCYLFKIRRYRRAGWNSSWHLPLYGGIQLPAAGGGGPRLQVPHTLYRKFLTYIPRNETAQPRSQCLHTKSHTQIHECLNWETEHYHSVLEITRLRSFISGNT